MVSWAKRYTKQIIVAIILIGSVLAMINLKPLYELDRDSTYEDQFRMAQVVFILTLLYIITEFVFNRWKAYKSLKNAHSEAQLELLKTKMDPHFFFNTLNNLYGLAIEKSEDTGPIILKLSEVMRYNIYEGAKESVSIKEEINHLNQYIEIHKIRYKKRVHIQLEEDIYDEEAQVAPLLFINLLENAFKHGVESLTDDAFIKIKFKTSPNEVYFSIENNYLPEQNHEKHGIGLSNLKERLRLTYPKRHSIEIHQAENVFRVELKLSIA
ncbi:sensor histidine kinase [Roseivirga misakiensis]|uniref:Signal transduction histidine kinase internal region domain-containing protein n=1 Tax=Roseivirga misakiensis TaxID=1563681 RepID=A0A1E5SZ35_9BACT|nr:histidine kinase [Roseivirga misakiensis]OEK04394.1 hypothetical protein BFP71_13005 [Roseivirga misakiensis]